MNKENFLYKMFIEFNIDCYVFVFREEKMDLEIVANTKEIQKSK